MDMLGWPNPALIAQLWAHQGRRSEGSEGEMQWRREAVLALRRGVVGALASGGARVIRACAARGAAVRKGAQAEAGWRRAPRARAEGFRRCEVD